MPETVVPGPVSDSRNIREAVSVHVTKIFDSCRDKDCVEDLRVYLTRGSQEVIDRAQSVKAASAELLYAYIDVEPVSFNRGFYTVDVRYFYRITADAFVGAARPIQVVGLAVFSKRTVLFGSESASKSFSSNESDNQVVLQSSLPTAVVEAVDPLILNLKLVDVNECRPCDCGYLDVPTAVAAVFDDELVIAGDQHRLFITLGQFSIIRMERDTQLLIPAYDYWIPTKDCSCGEEPCQEDPCDLFRQVQFPVDEFFPPNSITTTSSASTSLGGCCR